MGTKLQYAINPFATASNNSFAVNQLSDWGTYSQEIEPRHHLNSSPLHHFKYSMNKMFDFQNIECIKKTMLMQEDIFKRQVRELHRLYDRQMKLVYELKKEMTHNRGRAITAKNIDSEFSIWHQQMRDIKPNLLDNGLKGDSEERSASGSTESPRMEKGFSLKRLDKEGPSTSIRGVEQDQKGHNNSSRPLNTNQMNIHVPDEEINVELTLSIGCGSSKKRLKSQLNGGELRSSTKIKRDSREELVEPSPAVSSSTTATLSQNAARSNWLFQDLSLSRT